MRTLLALAALAAVTAAIALSAGPVTRPGHTGPSRPSITTPRPSSTTRRPVRTPAPPRLERAAINRQDRSKRRDRTREARVFDTRPLLSRLPLTRAGVRIDIAGLAADDHSTVLAIDPGQRSRAHARAVYHHALQHAHDPGDGYVLEWAR